MKRPQQSYVVVVTTCGSRREAQRLAHSVVEKKLAACANVLATPVGSIYRWKGKIEEGREYLLLMKSSRAKLAALEREVERLHSYDVPEVVVLPIIGGSRKYLDWLGDCLKDDG